MSMCLYVYVITNVLAVSYGEDGGGTGDSLYLSLSLIYIYMFAANLSYIYD